MEPLPNPWQVESHADASSFQDFARADARTLKKLGRAECSSRKYQLSIDSYRLKRAFPCDFGGAGLLLFDKDLLNPSTSQDRQVWTIENRLQENLSRPHSAVIEDVEVQDPGSVEVASAVELHLG